MYLADQPRLGERKHVMVTSQVVRVPGKRESPVSGFVQTISLDHGPHGSIEDHDALAQKRFQQTRLPHTLPFRISS
jgi:hypothetical protein